MQDLNEQIGEEDLSKNGNQQKMKTFKVKEQKSNILRNIKRLRRVKVPLLKPKTVE